MTGSGAGAIPSAAGGPARHVPVLAAEVVAGLALKPGGHYLDGTFGAGGYVRAMFAAEPAIRMLALDRDPEAVAGGAAMVAEFGGRLRLVEARFGGLDDLARKAGFLPLDGVSLDIGVSSMQLDEAARGFSFRFEAPLDMRMEQSGRSAADILNEASESAIADILFHFGEERRARPIARRIVGARLRAPIRTTAELVAIIESIEKPRFGQIHPATRSFQALRIAVNDELGELQRGLAAAERALAPGGRLAVVTFHSLEDRIVKHFLAVRSGRGEARSRRLPGEAEPPQPSFRLISRKPVEPSDGEIAANPRARSARLRIAERLDAPAFAAADFEGEARR
jgi:16S rRNA (cytosine1402-N4)-methyltransferase